MVNVYNSNKEFAESKQQLDKSQIIFNNLSLSKEQGIAHIYADDEVYSGRHVTINGKEILAFGFCSYLGLEKHPKVKEGMIEAVKKYGIHFPSSRAYISTGLFKKLNRNLCTILRAKHISVFSSITLGHLSTLPSIISKNDAVIYDQQAHFTMQSIAPMLPTKNINMVKHNNMDKLDDLIKQINEKNTPDKIWYIADGVYSMYGDSANYEGIQSLQIKYPNLYLYLDDAHGMSWTGKHGCGDARSHLELNNRTVLALSLGKGFGSGGGAIVFPDEEMKEKMICGGRNYTFSGPMFPPSIGAAIASSEIHLSSEIYELQDSLKEKIIWTNQLAQDYSIPTVGNPDTPIFFVAAGLNEVVSELCISLLNSGFHTNPCAYPAVPQRFAGIRFSISNHHSFEDIENLMKTFGNIYDKALKNNKSSRSDVNKFFKRLKSYNPVD